MVREAPPRSPGLWELREDLHDVVRPVEKSEVDDLERQIRNAGAVDQHVTDRDPLLGVDGELRQVFAHRIVEMDEMALIEEMHGHRRHRLAGREDAEGAAGVASTFAASGGSAGPLPAEWPIARSSTTRPRRRTQSAIAGWMPLR